MSARSLRPGGPLRAGGSLKWPHPARSHQVHPDLGVDDPDRAQADILDLGASLLDAGDGRRSRRIFAAPAGRPFPSRAGPTQTPQGVRPPVSIVNGVGQRPRRAEASAQHGRSAFGRVRDLPTAEASSRDRAR
ncbi:hypothetical protein JS756_31370 [Streptomyces actuosus]|uniref:Glyoxalase-like domain-containing protein n=1 Tax=Streptomyces actuosus TaxID=1885 RepID=A0ABS2VZE6_STRAS|nr:VOC family protein [Streptomyces actuosus]MBN0048520.1 hypothetical protein [Streptomyces actuosus]